MTGIDEPCRVVAQFTFAWPINPSNEEARKVIERADAHEAEMEAQGFDGLEAFRDRRRHYLELWHR